MNNIQNENKDKMVELLINENIKNKDDIEILKNQILSLQSKIINTNNIRINNNNNSNNNSIWKK
jgi:hypothetical protein